MASGGYHFFLLDTDEVVVLTTWTGNIPLTQALVNRINEIASREEAIIFQKAEQGKGKQMAMVSSKPNAEVMPAEDIDCTISIENLR